jgi:hypothetical protein
MIKMVGRGRPVGSKNGIKSDTIIPVSDIKGSMREEILYGRLLNVIFHAQNELGSSKKDISNTLRKLAKELKVK